MTSRGHVIAFEGLDQSGKQTQSERLLDTIRSAGHATHFLSFPAYETEIGGEIGRALRGERDYQADVMQLLYIANRYEHRPSIEHWLDDGDIVVCDRYLASSIAYGEAQGLDPQWLAEMQRHLPQPSLTVLLDIPPEASLARKQRDRDRYERDLQLLARVRNSYRRQALQPDWVHVDGTLDKDAVTRDVITAVRSRLGLR